MVKSLQRTVGGYGYTRCALEALKHSERIRSQGRGQLETLLELRHIMETLACSSAPANMEVSYTDEPESPLPHQAQVPAEHAEWDELQEYVDSSDEEHTSQDYFLDPPQADFGGGLLDRSQVYLPSNSEPSSRAHLLRDPSPLFPQRASQDHHHGQAQDRPQQMLEIRSFQWAGLERFESAIAEPSVDTYDDDDVQWWHYFVGESRSEWDEVQVIALIAFMVIVCFVGVVMVWIMIT